MIFESLWPLFFLAAIPIIIILYLLKPKGIDYRISSNLLWQKLLRNEQSRTFFEKFVHNILMYLQIVIAALLVIALMAPFIQIDSHHGGRKILLFDTSASMQHVGSSGKSRMTEAIERACDDIRTAQGTQFSIVTVDVAQTKLLAVDSTDIDSLLRTVQNIDCSDSGGTLVLAQEMLDTLMEDTQERAADLWIYTDGSGAADAEALRITGDHVLYVAGETSWNVANEYTVFTMREDGLYDVMVSVANYSDANVTLDVSLYDEGQNLIAVKQVRLNPSESTFCLFDQVDWQGQTLSSRLSGITFAGGGSDSLDRDNVSQVVKSRDHLINGLFVGDGNTFLEKAYQAVTGESIAKAKTDDAVGADYNVVIYDAGKMPQDMQVNRLIFGDAGKEVTETLKNVVLDMTDCDLTAGLSGFTIGVNKAFCFALPEGAQSFLEYNGNCVGYYIERDGVKEVVVGFDIRESDFPLRAEFPVFLANAMIYLSDTSWLATNSYYAGEEIALQPWAKIDRSLFDSRPRKAGLFQVGDEEYQESYVVRFQTTTESDGRKQADSVNEIDGLQMQKVKHTLRNVFLVLVLILLVVEWIIYVRQSRYRGKFYLAVRGIVLFCVLLTFFGIQIHRGSSKTATVFVVDLSNSNAEHVEEMEEYLQKTVEKMPSGNVYGIVSFGKKALVEQFLTAEKQYGGLMTLPEKMATNFEDAISKALTLIPGEYSKRIVVLTDGKETRGNIQNMAQVLTESQTEFLSLIYEDEELPDTYIDNVILPAYLHPGDKYSITVLVESNYDTDAVIELYRGSSQVAANSVHLNKGSNRFVFSAQVDAAASGNAMESLSVQVKAPEDSCPENNTFSAYSVVETAPKVLVISGRDTNVSDFSSVLQTAGCDYNVVTALNTPDTIQEMLHYKSMILVDTYIDDLPMGFLQNLETYVKDYGCGFICCGGENSFALGGYRDTVVETVLPVDMQLRGANEIPSMAMVMVIDHSGSMVDVVEGSSASNLDIAIRASTVAVDNLSDSDYVGVLTFDDQYSWQVELGLVDDKSAIKDKIKQVHAGGGTTIKPALQEACAVLAQSDVSIKHVVLLTDGMGEINDFSDVISDYKDSNITLSTVAVGDYSDTRLLEQLADQCGGRYYYSDMSSDIPKIFAQEVFLGGDSYIQNGVFSLAVQKGHELTNNLFADSWPVVYGYISATPKTASNSIIVTGEKGDPLLTVWQYGLGRTVAWNSDVTGEWSGAFVGQDDYVQMWKRIVDYATGNANMGSDRVDVVTVGDRTEVNYQTKDYDNGTQIEVMVVDPQGNTTEEVLHAIAPGKYTAELSTPQTGLYYFNVRRTANGEVQNYMTTAAAVQFADEYKFDIRADSYLQFVEQYGRIITPQDSIWTRIVTRAKETYSLTNWLLVLALCLFVIDVALRRFQYVPKLHFVKEKKHIQKEVEKLEKSQIEHDHEAVHTQMDNATQTENSTQKKQKQPKKTKKVKQSEQTLDTSQLLKKKDDRQI